MISRQVVQKQALVASWAMISRLCTGNAFDSRLWPMVKECRRIPRSDSTTKRPCKHHKEISSQYLFSRKTKRLYKEQKEVQNEVQNTDLSQSVTEKRNG